MTKGQRQILENFRGNDTPLCRAIAAALEEIDRLEKRQKSPLECGRCHGLGYRPDEDKQCCWCGGTGVV